MRDKSHSIGPGGSRTEKEIEIRTVSGGNRIVVYLFCLLFLLDATNYNPVIDLCLECADGGVRLQGKFITERVIMNSVIRI
jgi:hypothetical protein